MDWERLIPGHPGAPDGRLGTKQDAQDQFTFLQDASAAVKIGGTRREMLGPGGERVETAEILELAQL